jgi:hypothetical protein
MKLATLIYQVRAAHQRRSYLEYMRPFYPVMYSHMAIMQRRATCAVFQAIKQGKLARPSAFACADCGKPATQYDHRDYSRPLHVEPVCGSCNKLRGPGETWASGPQ